MSIDPINDPESKLRQCLSEFDQLNAQDPNSDTHNGAQVAKELLYSQRMTARLAVFNSGASELLKLAAHAQHIQRWKSPRSDYPEGRSGYMLWRKELGAFHAEVASNIMRAHDYSEADCLRVAELLQKKNLKRDAEVQCLEDVICLVFIEFYLLDFVHKYSDSYSEEKLFKIVQKTWKKMSPSGHAAALELPLDNDLLELIKRALNL